MKLAIFDIDGTLTETNKVDNECFVKAFADSHNITGIETDWTRYKHVTDSGIALEIFNERLDVRRTKKIFLHSKLVSLKIFLNLQTKMKLFLVRF
jgi:beta-phosphoglucomutase-like phosphatase (HAD superfamily)